MCIVCVMFISIHWVMVWGVCSWAESVVMPTTSALWIFGNDISGESEFN